MARATGIVGFIWTPNLEGMVYAVPPRTLPIPAHTWLRVDQPGTGPRAKWFRTIAELVLPQGLLQTVGVEAMADGADHNIATHVSMTVDAGWLRGLNDELTIASFGAFTGGSDIPSVPAIVPADGSTERFLPGSQLYPDALWAAEHDRLVRERQRANTAAVTITANGHQISYMSRGTDWVVQPDEGVVWFDGQNEDSEIKVAKKVIQVPDIRPATLREIWID